MKFVIVALPGGTERAIITVEDVNHSDAVNKLDVKPISAGFFTRKAGRVEVDMGRGSNSLDLKPRAQDAEIIETTLLLGGVL